MYEEKLEALTLKWQNSEMTKLDKQKTELIKKHEDLIKDFEDQQEKEFQEKVSFIIQKLTSEYSDQISELDQQCKEKAKKNIYLEK